MKKSPFFTIIIPTFNSIDFIERCLQSIFNQNFREYEIVVIDGESKDGTLEILNSHLNKISTLISELDQGIYDAMNKGIDKANGQWIFFLGSDDFLHNDNVLLNIYNKIQMLNNSNNNKELLLIYSNVLSNNNKIINSKFNSKLLLHNTLHHQSAFYKKEIFKKFKYDTSFKLLGDYDLNLFLYKKKIGSLYLNETIAVCSDSGVSNDRKNYSIIVEETRKARHKNFPSFLSNIFHFIFIIKFNFYKLKFFLLK